MNISVVGVGKLGLCLSLNLEKKGFNVLGVDVVDDYVNSLNKKSFKSLEPYVTEYLKKSKNIKFTTDLKSSLNNDVIFVVVQTPSTTDGKYNHKYIEEIAEKLIEFGKQDKRKDLIINCTTFPGYCDSLHEKLNKYNYYVSYNPEFIAQGSIIQDQLMADSVLIGGCDTYAEELISDIWLKVVDSKPFYHKVSRIEAEIIKLSVNCFITTKISFANMVGNMVKKIGGDMDKVLNVIGESYRAGSIGNPYLKYGFGYGGPCFPRDNRALAVFAEELGVPSDISVSTDNFNRKHLDFQINEFIENNDIKKPIKIDGVTYKKNSNIIEESQQLAYAVGIAKAKFDVTIVDTKDVLERVKNLHGDLFKYEETNKE